MGQIQILDEVTANQIAAGEVIERPQSVIKELIENALDANAQQVDVHVDEGGASRMVVIDDGDGMSPEDAVLCFSRYATSKLRQVADLSQLNSFGFRGEALASIASVAKVRLLTRRKNSSVATEVRIEGGKVVGVQESGGPVGTRLEIESLFFNVPARLKFLKAPRSESAAIENTIRVATLSKPHVGFSLRVDGTMKFDARQAPADAELEHPRRVERAIASLGEECRTFLHPFSNHTELVRISGYVVAPLVTRKDSKGIRLYINGRSVEDRQLIQAIRVAYRTLLEVGRHPICALNIEIDPSEVDVNVHPQKREVRFSDASRVQGHVIRLLSDFLATTPWLRNRVERTYSLKSEPRVAYTMFDNARAQTPILSESKTFSLSGREEQASFLDVPAKPGFALFSSPASIQTQPSLDGSPSYADLRVIGQVDSTFLVLEGQKSMIVLDQHAAHERVVFQRLKEQVATQSLPSQPLLFPQQISLSPTDMATLNEFSEAFLRYGFEILPFGEAQALIKSVPADLRIDSIEEIIRDALAELAAGGRPDALDDMSDHLCAQIACHSSIRAGQVLQHAEIQALLIQLDQIDYGAHCPHGRPVVRAISFDEIAKWFHRS